MINFQNSQIFRILFRTLIQILGVGVFLWNWGMGETVRIQNNHDFFFGLTGKEIPYFTEIIVAQASTSTPTLTNNVYYYVDTNSQPTIWDRYYSTTKTHPLRRADVLFFISIPFTILWTDFWIQRFRDFSLMGAYFEGVRGNLNLRNVNFTYYHDTYPSSVDDPFYIFKWVNAVLWPLIIVGNDFLERISDPVKWEKEKKEMLDNRFHLNLIYLPTH